MASLGSSFGGMERVANTSSIFWEVSLSRKRPFGAIGGRSEPWTTSSMTSFGSVEPSAYFVPSREVLAVGGASGGLP